MMPPYQNPHQTFLKWKGSIFLIKQYFWKNIYKFFFYSRFKFQMLGGPPCRRNAVVREELDDAASETHQFFKY